MPVILIPGLRRTERGEVELDPDAATAVASAFRLRADGATWWAYGRTWPSAGSSGRIAPSAGCCTTARRSARSSTESGCCRSRRSSTGRPSSASSGCAHRAGGGRSRSGCWRGWGCCAARHAAAGWCSRLPAPAALARSRTRCTVPADGGRLRPPRDGVRADGRAAVTDYTRTALAGIRAPRQRPRPRTARRPNWTARRRTWTTRMRTFTATGLDAEPVGVERLAELRERRDARREELEQKRDALGRPHWRSGWGLGRAHAGGAPRPDPRPGRARRGRAGPRAGAGADRAPQRVVRPWYSPLLLAPRCVVCA